MTPRTIWRGRSLREGGHKVVEVDATVEADGASSGVSKSGKRRVLHEAGLSWQRTRSWCRTGTVQRKRKAGVVEVTDPDATAKKT